MMGTSDHASSDQNDNGTSQKSGSPVTQPRSRAVRFNLLSKYGRVHGTYSTAVEGRRVSEKTWPGEEHDGDSASRGWYIEPIR